MELLTDIAKLTIPALLVLATAYYVLKTLLDEHRRQRHFEYKLNNQKLITPLQLQAMERTILFLERITLEALITRLMTPQMTASHLGRDMIQAINSEYAHNLSQQLYLTEETWHVVKNTKDHVIKFITMVSKQVDPKAPAGKLATALLETAANSGEVPNEIAIKVVKEELEKIV